VSFWPSVTPIRDEPLISAFSLLLFIEAILDRYPR
jgi:hypothetical protein